MPFNAVENVQPFEAQSRWDLAQARCGALTCSPPANRKLDPGILPKSTHAAAPGYTRLRRFPRRPFDVRIEVAVLREGAKASLWGRTNELGMDGVGATLSGELGTGEVVGVEFPIPVAPYLMKVRAIVRYSQGLRCGFEFLVVTGEQREYLRRACEVVANS